MTGQLLVVEDEEHLAFGLRFNLESEGYDVHVAPTIAEARSALSSRFFDLVVLDVMLPDGDGLSLCRERRALGDRTPVLFLTAKGTPDEIIAGLDSGGDDYLSKPFDLRELLGRIAALLRRRRWDGGAANTSRLAFGRARLDFDTRQAEVDGEPATFTDLEWRLIAFFAANENRIVSREDLLENVWEVSANVHTRTVDNFLVRLRKVFERDPADPQHFVTVRGVGYRFVPDST